MKTLDPPIIVVLLDADLLVVVAVAVAVIDSYSSPSLLNVQWHLTNRCNLRCAHCYQDDFTDNGLSLQSLRAIADQVFALQHAFSATSATKETALLFTMTGGEPFFKPELIPLLRYLNQHSSQPSIRILSNGTLLNQAFINQLKGIRLRSIQLSIEGDEETHNSIRGDNNFAKVIEASQLLKQNKIPVVWSFTANNQNFRSFPIVAKLAYHYQIDYLWSDRMIPDSSTSNSTLQPRTLNPNETLEYLHLMAKMRHKYSRKRNNQTSFLLNRALQFQVSGGSYYQCIAEKSLITIMPNGDLYPCRRLPIKIGNLEQEHLIDLYRSDTMQEIAHSESPKECSKCLFKRGCRGGLKCLAYAINRNINMPDPGCSML